MRAVPLLLKSSPGVLKHASFLLSGDLMAPIGDAERGPMVPLAGAVALSNTPTPRGGASAKSAA